ncbi:MAG TPA: hypothetical protein VNM48_07710 [Chloroflexota bacterium]|nr:hypothetical protein [Chloroflexota bacterium]
MWRKLQYLAPAFLVACATQGIATPSGPAVTGAGTAVSAARLGVRSAKVEYYQAGPTDPVVELQIIVENTAGRHTDSTSILWDPEFARGFTFLRSDPPPWRVRIDERGWGSLDTAGVIPGEYGTFKLWFAAGTYAPLEPRIQVVANGVIPVGDVIAKAGHLVWQVPSASQRAFENGRLADATAFTSTLTLSARAAFAYALALGMALSLITVAGGLAAFRAVYQHERRAVTST